MKSIRYIIPVIAVMMGCSGLALAQEGSVVSLNLVPIQSAFVKGDDAKFRAINWTKDSAQTGVQDASLDAKLGKDTHVSFEGSGMVGDHDYTGSILITKDNVGFIKTDYKGFRQYFDGTTGFYPYNTRFSVNTPSQELQMDVGHLSMEIGRGTPEDSPLSFIWERDTKNGNESVLDWAAVKSTVAGSGATQITKDIGPAYQNMNETTDKLTLRGKAKLLGFNVKGSGSYEFAQLHPTNYQYTLDSTYTGAAFSTANDIRKASEDIQTKAMSSSVLAERWMLNDKTYLSFGYNFSHLRNTDIEIVRIYNPTTGAWTYSSTSNRDSHALNTENTHTWTTQLLTNLTPTLTFVSKAKAELKAINSSSENQFWNSTLTGYDAYPGNYRDEQRETNTAEGFSLRYSGIPKTSLYSDLELSQEHSTESLQAFANGSRSGIPSVLFYYQSMNRAPGGLTADVGSRFYPFKSVNVTTEFKHTEKNDKSNNYTNTATPFISNFMTAKDEVSTRLAWKPFKWLENSFRASEASDTFHTQAYTQDYLKAQGIERNFTYDLTWMPTNEWMFTASYGLQLLKQSSPAEQATLSNGRVPVFTANVYTWSFNSSYAPTQTFSVFNTLSYSRAKNPNNNYESVPYSTATTMMYGEDDEWYNAELGIKWDVKKNLSIEPHYAYYGFRSYQGLDTGNYSAQILWCEVKTKW